MLRLSGTKGVCPFVCLLPALSRRSCVGTGGICAYALLSRRRVELERKLASDPTMSDERKQRQLQQLGKRESAFLRLRRTKLGLDDFRTVKVIGKGAFGEVRYNTRWLSHAAEAEVRCCRCVSFRR